MKQIPRALPRGCSISPRWAARFPKHELEMAKLEARSRARYGSSHLPPAQVRPPEHCELVSHFWMHLLFSHSRFPSATDITCNVIGVAAGLALRRNYRRTALHQAT